MKEKQEYAKMLTGKKNAFEMQSQASVREPNAYDYGGEVQSKIQEINDKLQRFNPSLIGSQIVASDTYDTEAAVIEMGRRDKRRQMDSRIDDTKSMMSAMTNASAVSRRSGVSLLDIGSIASANPSSMGGTKKLPGERGLRANAERRLEKAQMTRIDAHLARLQNTEDLSYSEKAVELSARDDQNRMLVDETTLLRLIDECRDEQEHLSLMEGSSSKPDDISSHHSSHLGRAPSEMDTQSELAKMQLALIDM